MSRILLVDDDDLFRKALEMSLRTSGFEVISASNGQIATEWLKLHKADLIISDIQMPKVDGIALIKAVRANSQTPIILMTGFSEIFEIQEAYNLGANEFLTKPFKQEEILAAIERCLKSSKQDKALGDDSAFCRIGINDFLYGKQITFNIFLRLSEGKYIRVAYEGNDLSNERIEQYRSKGINYLYLRVNDFREYLGIGLQLTKKVQKIKGLGQEKKINLLRHVGEVLLEQVYSADIDKQMFDDASVFLESTINILSDDTHVVDLLNALNDHADYLLAHSLGVSIYSIMITNALKWELASHKFKVATGGLFHEIGCKEIPVAILERQRLSWGLEDVKLYESHPERGIAILKELSHMSLDILQIVHQHHENCSGRGFPLKIRKNFIHPMARIISVADEFCYRTIKHPTHKLMSPVEAIIDMTSMYAENLDSQFITALGQLFNCDPMRKKSKFI